MSYNGSGTFNINTTGQPVVAGTIISSAAFNALTADLATGLTTAITKDGQTTATARIPFAQGITSTLVTDASSTATGSIITAGGVGIAKKLYVGTDVNIAGLTASSAVATDASKNLVSVTNTGTGSNVLATGPTIASVNLTTALTLTGAAGTSGQVLTSSGTGAAPVWGSAPNPTVASQAEMEAATSNTVFVTPLNTKWHPGISKVWLKAAANGTAINASYNVTSITDDGVGSITVTIATDFSSADYTITTFGAGANNSTAQLNYVTAQAAGSFSADCINPNFTNRDPQFAWFFACFGDQ